MANQGNTNVGRKSAKNSGVDELVEFRWNILVQGHSCVPKIKLWVFEELFNFRHCLEFGWPILGVRSKRCYGNPRLLQDCKFFTPHNDGVIVLQAAAISLELAFSAASLLELSYHDILGLYFRYSLLELQLGVLQGLSLNVVIIIRLRETAVN
jgi:hypothetical protein